MATLDNFPRITLGHWPTPIEAMPRLGKEIGNENLFIKRDDCSGLGFGGNKVRKLEFLMAEAHELGATRIITVGGVQSNHARQTAAACAKLGLECHLVLPRMVTSDSANYETSGNILLDQLFGAKVHITDDQGEAGALALELIEEARAAGGEAFFMPAGGATPIGSLGFARAAHELHNQEKAEDERFDRIVIAVSTAGSLAGLTVGYAAMEEKRAIEAIMVYAPSDEVSLRTSELIDQTAALLDIPSPGLRGIKFRDKFLGPGYGQPTDEMREALSLAATHEGIVLDPAYTGKAMAALIAMVRTGEIGTDERILFWHTGGAPALFAQGDVLAVN